MPARSSLNSLFADFAHYARDVAVVQRRGYRRESWTYAQLASMARACAYQYRERGAGIGDRILICGPNSAQWVAAFWGCLLIGAVAVPLDQGSTPEFAGRVARETSAKMIVASRDTARLLAATRSRLFQPPDTQIPSLILEDLPEITARQGAIVDSRPQGSRPSYDSLAGEPITRSHIAQILFTSGTTAEPRGVVLTHGNFLANLEPLERGIDPYRKYERWMHPLRFVTLVPLSHVFGQFMALYVPPLLGATIVFEPSANPSEITRTVKRERATALIAVPRMLDGLHNGLIRDLETRSQKKWLDNTLAFADGKKFLHRAWLFRRIHRRFGWKFWAFISGGAALSPETESFFKRIGYAVVQGYGMTETASLISLNHPFRAAQGTIGKPLPGREFKLAEDGEILVRGDNVANRYWQAGALQSSGDDSWLRTGDIGELDAEGNLRFRGRKKNVIVTPAGLNVYPEDLEAALRNQAGVRDCVVVPVERGGNAEPCAALLMGPPGDLAAQRVVETANRSLAEFQRMRIWVIWPDPDFPRTPTGKPRLAEISAGVSRMLAGGSPATHSANTSGSLEQLLGRLAGRTTASSSPEEQLNLSSLDRVELMSAIEERYQVELSETAFAEAKTIADVERLIHQATTNPNPAEVGARHGLARHPDSRDFSSQPPSAAPAPLPNPPASRPAYTYPRWAQTWPIRLTRLAIYYALVWPATQILGHPKIVGRENLRGLRGPVLVVSNHITRRADMGLILAALPSRFRHRLATAMGGETLRRMRRPPREWFFLKRWSYFAGYWLVTALFNVFPLPQFSGFRESFRFAGESIDRGFSVLVFPEGETNESTTGEMAKFQSGIGLLAENLRVPIVPIRLDGVWKMKRERRRLARFGEIIVHIAKPITFPPGMSADEIAPEIQLLVSRA